MDPGGGGLFDNLYVNQEGHENLPNSDLQESDAKAHNESEAPSQAALSLEQPGPPAQPLVTSPDMNAPASEPVQVTEKLPTKTQEESSPKKAMSADEAKEEEDGEKEPEEGEAGICDPEQEKLESQPQDLAVSPEQPQA